MPERPTREEVDDLIVRTREAHGVLKDIKAATKELQDTIKQANEMQVKLLVTVVHAADEAIGDAVATGLANYSNAITDAIDNATEAVYRRFDVIASILLGESDEEKETLEDAARLVRKSMDKNVHLTSVEEWQMEEIQKAVERRLGEPRMED